MHFFRYFLPAVGGLALGLLLALGWPTPALNQPQPPHAAAGRQLAVPVEEMVAVEIATVAIAERGAPVVLLREPNANKVVPIFIGPEQAIAISHALRATRMARPMTHDLLLQVINSLKAELLNVYVDDLRDSAFMGMLELAVPGRSEPLHIDSRPSDALALAVRAGAGIHIAPKVLEVAQAIEYEGLDDEVVSAVGITVNLVTDELRAALSLPERKGVLVSNVTGPAAEAGLRPGALILKVNGQPPTTPMEFLELIRTTPEGEKAKLVYWQEGDEHRLEISTEVTASSRQRDRRRPGIAL